MWPFRGATVEPANAILASRDTIRRLQALGRAATTKGVESLGRLTTKGVEVAASGVSLVPVTAVPFVLNRHTSTAVAATMKLSSDVNGWGLLLLDRADALRLVDLLLQRPPGSTTQLSALEASAVAETANIALNQMVTVFARDAGASIRTSAPETSFDAKSRLSAVGLSPAGEDHAVLVETAFVEKGANVKGTMVLVLYLKAAGK